MYNLTDMLGCGAIAFPSTVQISSLCLQYYVKVTLT